MIGFIDFAAMSSLRVAFSDSPLNGSGDKIGAVISALRSDPITKVAIWVDRVVGTSPTYKVSLQSVTDGLPNGTILGGGSPAEATFSATGTDEAQIIVLDNSYTPSIGDSIAIVVEYDSGTIDGSNFADIGTIQNLSLFHHPTCVGVQDLSAGSWSLITSGTAGAMALGTATEWYGAPLYTQKTQANRTNSSTPNEYGMKFTVPSQFSTFPLQGLAFIPVSWIAGGTTTMSLYSGGGASDTTTMATKTIDHDAVGANRAYSAWFDSIQNLTGGSEYRISLRPDGAQGMRNYWVQNTENDLWQLHNNLECESTNRSGGNWTDNPDCRVLYSLLYNLNDVVYSSGGGGVSLENVKNIVTGMSGGMRG